MRDGLVSTIDRMRWLTQIRRELRGNHDQWYMFPQNVLYIENPRNSEPKSQA